MTAKRFLVTGGTGFLGAALVKNLLASGHTVRVFDNNSRGNVRRLDGIFDDIEFIEGDIRDPEAVKNALAGVDSVCHLAFVNGTEFFYTRPELVLDVGVKGMVNVLDACIAHQVGELILASSSEVYHLPPTIPTPEEVPLVIPDPHNPRYSYAAGKMISEIMALNYGQKFFDRVVIFRPHNVYGADMGWEHVIPQFILRVHHHPNDPIPFEIQGSGKETRAFVYIDDFTAGLARVINQGEHLGIYHIGTQDEVAIAEVAHMVAAVLERQIVLVPSTAPAGGTPRRCPDISKLVGLGYSPQITLTEGIQRTAAWYIANAQLAPKL